MAYGGQYGNFYDAFGSSFVEGLLGMMKIDLERDRLSASTEQQQRDFELRQAADERAARAAELQNRQTEYTFGQQQMVPEDIASIAAAAAPQAAAQTTRPYSPTEPELGDLTSYTPGRPAALTTGDLFERGVDPRAYARVQQYAPKTIEGLGLMTPEAATDYRRKQQGLQDFDALMSQPIPTDPGGLGNRLGALTAAGQKAGLITGEQAIKHVQDAWKDDPAGMNKFMTDYQTSLGNQPAAPGPNGMIQRHRAALMDSVMSNVDYFYRHPEFAKEMGADQILRWAPAEKGGPRTVTPLPSGSPGFAVTDPTGATTFQPVPGGGTADYAAGPNGVIYSKRTGQVIREPTPAQPRDPLAARDELQAQQLWKIEPTDDAATQSKKIVAQQIFTSGMAGVRAQQKGYLAQSGTELQQTIQSVVDNANRTAFPERFPAGTNTPTVSGNWLTRYISGLLGQAQPGAMGAGAPQGQIPNPMGAGAPGAGAAPPVAAPPTGVGQARGRSELGAAPELPGTAPTPAPPTAAPGAGNTVTVQSSRGPVTLPRAPAGASQSQRATQAAFIAKQLRDQGMADQDILQVMRGAGWDINP